MCQESDNREIEAPSRPTPMPPQWHPNATPMASQCHPNATPMPPQCHPNATLNQEELEVREKEAWEELQERLAAVVGWGVGEVVEDG